MKLLIESLIQEEKYSEAYQKIRQILKTDTDLSDEDYTEYIKLHIKLSDLLNKEDIFLQELLSRKKHLSSFSHQILGNGRIKLMLQNLFLIKADAYVTYVHDTKYFNYLSDVNFARHFLEEIPEKNLYRRHWTLRQGPVYYQRHEHRDMRAPQSYLIHLYKDDVLFDPELFKNATMAVLEDALKNKLKNICFSTPGYEFIARAENGSKSDVSSDIMNSFCNVISNFFIKNKNRSVPEVWISFVDLKLINDYDRALFHISKLHETELINLRQKEPNHLELVRITGTRNERYSEQLRKICMVLDQKTPILLRGETGVGKSFLAKEIHNLSCRKDQKFVPYNCAALKPGNAVSTLFGWEKGAFTDAQKDGPGLVKEADEGTLFLDEIGYAEISVQQMLLKFLDDGEYHRYNSPIAMKSDVRIIFGTNVNLEKMIGKHIFQNDLYERISSHEVIIPPLRERKEDIEPIVIYVLAQMRDRRGINIEINSEALAHLKTFDWPGNIRQLQQYIEKLYNNCAYDHQKSISVEIINNDPPRNTFYTYKLPMMKLEKALTEIIRNWDKKRGKIMPDLLGPLVAKIYLDDLQMKRTESSEILGIDGSRGEDSTLVRFKKKYIEIKTKLYKRKSKKLEKVQNMIIE